jgi:hypothetical protein
MPFILPMGGTSMDDDSQTTTGGKEQLEEERQNRRQFFNGLGKWSLAIIAAVTAVRDGSYDAGGAGDPRQQIAKKKYEKYTTPHTDQPHAKHSVHTKDVTKPKPPGGTTGTRGGSLDRGQ